MFVPLVRDDRTPARAVHARAPARTSIPLPEHDASAVAEALARVSTPADEQVAAQQRAFNQMLEERAELQREANAISDLAMAQAKKDDELLHAWIRLI